MTKKKIIIFTSSGGNGHVSATKAITSYLEDEYEIKPVFIFEEVFKNIDPMAIISFGKITGEQLYNYFLRKRWYIILNAIYRIGNWYFRLQTKTMVRLLTQYLKKQKPDLIISVTPIINGTILQAAQAENIPFLLIPTDLDAKSFLLGIYKPTYKKFHLNLAFNDPLVKKSAHNARIHSDQISIFGLPIREDFFESKDRDALRKKYHIAHNKPIIVLMMGGQGNSSIQAFAQQLAKLTMPVHIIICVGKDGAIKDSLEKISYNPRITTTILGFTAHVSDLLAIADVLVTKSGSVSFCEGIYMDVPMILDATTTILYWERLNHVLLVNNDWGICLKRTSKLTKAITKILENAPYHKEIQERLHVYPKPRLDLAIKPLIQKMMAMI
jgi:processive 1,2-diacylglycerol beta-glucosyltransferase